LKYLAKTLFGLESILSVELENLGATGVKQLNRAVSFTGSQEMLYLANYCCRTAISILKPIADFRIKSSDDLYDKAIEIPWGDYLDADQTFSVVPVVNSPFYRHTGYPGLVLKDAVADWFRSRKGKRPSVGTGTPDLVINLHISNQQVDVSLDSSVVPLYKRGYRKELGEAPLNEVLAAGIIMLSGWDRRSSLTDPMCGSGTIPIEAALIASDIPSGSFRNSFGFQKWGDYDSRLFEKVKKDSSDKIKKPEIKIYASDISNEAINQTRLNADSASVRDLIMIEQKDFRDLKIEENSGMLIMNPPYGQRLKPSDPESLYSLIGTVLKHNFPGRKAMVITSDKELIKHIGLKPSAKWNLFNGSLECTLLKYELYEGSRKRSVAELNSRIHETDYSGQEI
jgi:putative N6-adenine-specific DNA methylase